MRGKLYLVDGSSLIYRAFYGLTETVTQAGLPTHAISGFTNMLQRLIREESPDYLAVVFDPPRGKTFRSRIYPDYKANRDATPEALTCQIPYIKNIVQGFNIQTLEAPDFEADDVIATLATRFATGGVSVTVVTGDKDLMQIVGDRVTLLDTMKSKRSGPAEVLERFGVHPEWVADVLGLAGDQSDNIPGIPGVGEKTAADLVRKYGDLESVVKWAHLITGKKCRENVVAYADQARLSKTLATVRYDVPLTPSLESLRIGQPDGARLVPLLNELELVGMAVQFTPPPPGLVEIYCDGACSGTGPGGYGAILRFGMVEKEISGFDLQATSQRMELLAAIHGLGALTKPCRAKVVSDSQYLVRGMNEWLSGWLANGKLHTPGAMPNQDLWCQLLALAKKHQIQWEWVRGHNNHYYNEAADRLARAGAAGAHSQATPAAPVSQPETLARPRPAAPPPSPQDTIPLQTDDDGQFTFC